MLSTSSVTGKLCLTCVLTLCQHHKNQEKTPCYAEDHKALRDESEFTRALAAGKGHLSEHEPAVQYGLVKVFAELASRISISMQFRTGAGVPDEARHAESTALHSIAMLALD